MSPTLEEERLLAKELGLLDQAAAVTRASLDACNAIGAKQDYSPDEMIQFEAFTNRFARLADMLIQRTFGVVETFDLDEPGTVRDRINHAEKKGLIGSARTFVEIRALRNSIAHEYLPDAIRAIFHRVLAYAPALLEAVERTRDYCRRYGGRAA